MEGALTVTSSPAGGPDPASLVFALVRGAWRTLAARAMAELRLADVLVDPGSAEEIAQRTGLHAPALDRLLKTVAALGLVTFDGERFHLTEAGSRLRSDVPGSDWGALMQMAAPWTLTTWQHLPDAVRTGRPVFEDVHGETPWAFLRSHEEAGRLFDAAMARQSKAEEAAALIARELTTMRTVVDVGGGKGHLLAQILSLETHLHGVLADQPDQIGRAADVFAAQGVADRARGVVCDFFESVPAEADAYILSNVLHDWDDERCLRILDRVREAAGLGARLVLVESLLPDDAGGVDPESADLRLLDLMMLLNFGARERSLGEYATLLEAAGFVDLRVAGGSGPQVMVAVRGSA